MAREIFREGGDPFPDLRSVKLGGEQIFPSDVLTLRGLRRGLHVIAQAGSTEFPSIALGGFDADGTPVWELQTMRYTFAYDPCESGWQPLVVRDDLPDRLFPFEGFFDTGDEARFAGGVMTGLRRRDDPAHAFFGAAEALLSSGCIHVQFDLGSGEVRTGGTRGGAALPSSIGLGGTRFRLNAKQPHRIALSNKMPLLLGLSSAGAFS